MSNPFDDEDGSYFVLTNEEGQHSLWPVFIDVPAGWSRVFGEAKRTACLEYVDTHWTDLRPKSLAIAQAENRSQTTNVGPTMRPGTTNSVEGIPADAYHNEIRS
ncbi:MULTISPECIES: MbtH family protein [Nocardiaceae]|uniref:Putative MbtH-like protein n=1 Tax=Rhodococcoides fascians D188 TaxID=1051973 RepID=G8JYX6_RHOFA|nr:MULTISPECIES: MbtH family protein [Rhodococcus]AET25247.1 putative MbtH-like protein [Rhodococcus fascians D188]AMY56273.1 hypothetical protein A3L23_04975 [Rhodococcus fascians D188]OZC43780.1 MbtH family protein [Rhodococcus sp. RS1C4]OZC51314.1 MbtH family protein [Rhodococcus sp. 06-621-2]OZC60733.1 MbtH family protein [Rhodococcus sp. 06-469-3-2]